MRKHESFIISILTPVALGLLVGALTKNSELIYHTLNKPTFSPPSYLFPIVWLILYLLMGISNYLIMESDSIYKTTVIKLYRLQLIFNLTWSFIFFQTGNYLLSLIWILVLIILIIWELYYYRKINPLAFYLQIPYLLWTIFAAYLNYMIYILN